MEWLTNTNKNFNFHYIKRHSLNTVTICLTFRVDLTKENITRQVSLNKILLTQNSVYTNKELAIKKAELYGLKIKSNIKLLGNHLISSYYFNFINEKLLDENINDEVFAFIKNILFYPKFEEGTLSGIKTKLIEDTKKISGEQRAYTEMLKLMWNDNYYAFSEKGDPSLIKELKISDMLDYHAKMLESALDVYVIGNVDDVYFENKIANIFKEKTSNKINKLIIPKLDASLVKNGSRKGESKQSNLSVGLYLDNLSDFEKYYVLEIYNKIFGGNSNSVLYKKVRRKHSLCYNIKSFIDSGNDYMYIKTSSSPRNINKIKKLIEESLQNMQDGKFLESQFISAKKKMMSQILRAYEDSDSIISMMINKAYTKADDYILKALDEFDRVTVLDVINLAKKVKISSIYEIEGGKNDKVKN